MKKIFLSLALFIVLALLVILFFRPKFWEKKEAGKGTTQLKEITLAMGYIPNVQFAPFYVAQAKGYFAQEGLKVNFDYGLETDLISLLAKGELKFVVGSGDQVILAQDKELPVVMFLSWYKKFPVCLVWLESQKITRPENLYGKTVGIPAQVGASFIGWQAFLEKSGLDSDKINLKTIGYTQVESLTQGIVQAAIGYSLNEPVRLENSGYRVGKIEFADYANLPSNGLLTNQKTLQEEPELVKAVATAFLKGLQDTTRDPDEAFQLSKKYIPEMEDEALQKKVLLASIPFWDIKPLGKLDKEVWEEAVSLMTEFGLVKGDLEMERLFDYRFVE